MTVYSKFPKPYAAAERIDTSSELASHQWIVRILAEIVEYSEAHRLDAVADPLIAAIEEIAPALASGKVADEPAVSDGGIQGAREPAEVIRFPKKNLRG